MRDGQGRVEAGQRLAKFGDPGRVHF